MTFSSLYVLAFAFRAFAVVICGDELACRDVQDGLARNQGGINVLLKELELLGKVTVLLGAEVVQRHVQLFVSVATVVLLVLGRVVVASLYYCPCQCYCRVAFLAVFLLLGLYGEFGQDVVCWLECYLYRHAGLW